MTVYHIVNKQRNVIAAFAQRRECDGYEVDTVEKILAECPVVDHSREIGVCGTNHAHVGALWMTVAEHLVGVFLQYAEQFHLTVEIKFSDLIEKDSSSVGYTETAFTVGHSTGERPFLWPNISLSKRDEDMPQG